jgi:hypothetical protein
MRLKETQGHKDKSYEYKFEENYLILLGVETGQKLEQLWKSPCGNLAQGDNRQRSRLQ